MKHTTLRVQGVKSVASFIPKPITLENSRRLLCGQLRFPCWRNVVPNSTLSAAVLSEFHTIISLSASETLLTV